MANFEMRIGASKSGAPLIGAEACRNAVVSEWVYPSQFRYRVVARDADGGWCICTATAAKLRGLEIFARFPAADGSKRRR